MSSVAEIEQAIAGLSRRDFSSLAQWFEEERSRKWDLQMEEDEKSGKLQALHKRLEEENRDHAEIHQKTSKTGSTAFLHSLRSGLRV